MALNNTINRLIDANVVLNIVPLSLSKKTIRIGRMPEQDRDAYRKLRDEHWNTHAFRYDLLAFFHIFYSDLSCRLP